MAIDQKELRPDKMDDWWINKYTIKKVNAKEEINNIWYQCIKNSINIKIYINVEDISM